MSLATNLRPKTFNEVLGQGSTIKILKRQLETKSYANCYLFSGPTGVGKTTIARIFASEINQGQGIPIEVDAASNNGVDNVRELIMHANERSLDSEYKIIIVDECHMITAAGWNAFLKCLEEPPKYTIFIFCTTDAQKIPPTISNRLMRFNLTRIGDDVITKYLKSLSNQASEPGVYEYIAKISSGSVRTAISNLEKVISYGALTMENTLTALDGYDYDTLFRIINAITDNSVGVIVESVESFHMRGKDLRLLIEELIDVVMSISNYCIFKDMKALSIPVSYEEDLKYTAGVFETQQQNIEYFNKLANKILDIKFNIRCDANIKSTIKIMLINIYGNI